MIRLTPKTSQKKIFEMVGVSLWFSTSPDLNPLEYAIWGILENKTLKYWFAEDCFCEGME